MRKVPIIAAILAATFAAQAQSPNLNINRVSPPPPKPRAPETIQGLVQGLVPDRLASVGKKLKEVQGGLLHSAEMLGRLRAVRPQTQGQKAALAEDAQALMVAINEHRRSLSFATDTVSGLSRQPLSQSERAQAESYIKLINELRQNAQSVAGLTGEIVRQNTDKRGSVAVR